MPAARPWVIRTALGAPVEPDVKISTNRSSAAGPTERVARRRRRLAVSPDRQVDVGPVEHDGHAAEVETVEQRRQVARR